VLKEHPTLKSLCGNKGNETELDMSGKMNSPEDAIMLAAEIVDNGVLTSLDISNNDLGELVLPEEWTKGHGAYYPYDVEYTHADGRKQMENPGIPEGIIAIADAIRDMRALTKLDASDNSMFGEDNKSGVMAWADVIKTNTAITSLNLAKSCINGEDAKILGPAISGNGALSYETVTKDSFVAFLQKFDPENVPQAENLLSGTSTSQLLEFAKENFGEAPEVTIIPKVKGAMTSLSLASNNLGVEGAKIMAACLPKCM
jgi:hypothetical protein